MESIGAIVWHLTNKCNFSCDFCYTFSSPTQDYGLTEGDLQKVLDEINKAKPKKLSIIGGEPLLRKDFPIILNAIDTSIEIYLDSNGSLITSKWSDAFHKIKNINIGIDGNYSINELYRKNTNQVIEAIKFLVNKNIDVSVTMIVTSQNFQIIDESISFLFELGVKDITVNKFHKLMLSEKNNSVLTVEQSNIALKKIVLLLHSKPHYYEKLYLYGWLNNFFFDFFSPQVKNQTCGCGKTKATINCNADIVPCSVVAQKFNIDIFRKQFQIPNLLNSSIQEAFQSDIFSFFRNITSEVPEKCKQCEYNSQCSKGCRASSYLLSKSYMTVDANCQVSL
jgi:radical SAM protein with 4Fe4S-binding SPASM domain